MLFRSHDQRGIGHRGGRASISGHVASPNSLCAALQDPLQQRLGFPLSCGLPDMDDDSSSSKRDIAEMSLRSPGERLYNGLESVSNFKRLNTIRTLALLQPLYSILSFHQPCMLQHDVDVLLSIFRHAPAAKFFASFCTSKMRHWHGLYLL